MIRAIFSWLISNIKAALAIFTCLVTLVFIPTIKEGIAFINAGYQSTRDNIRQDRQIETITTSTIKTQASLENIEKMVTTIQNRDYDELRESRRRKEK